jgi:hypothetical protein
MCSHMIHHTIMHVTYGGVKLYHNTAWEMILIIVGQQRQSFTYFLIKALKFVHMYGIMLLGCPQINVPECGCHRQIMP